MNYSFLAILAQKPFCDPAKLNSKHTRYIFNPAAKDKIIKKNYDTQQLQSRYSMIVHQL